MPLEIRKVFETLGLTTKEILVFSTLLSGGSMLAAGIAKATRINRTTVYGLLKELEDKALVTSTTKGSVTRFQSIAPELLPGYIERRMQQLTDSKKVVEDALPQIKLIRSRAAQIPKVQLFEGRDGVEQAYEDMLTNTPDKKILALTGLEGVVNNLDPKFVDYFIKSRMRLGISADYIVPDTAIAREATLDDARKMRAAKFIPGRYDFNTEICMYGNRVGIYSYAQENPVALIIEDDTISRAMRQIFAFIDSQASD